MEKTTELLMGFRSLLRLYDKMLKKVCREHDLSVIEADVVSFLQNNPGKNTAVDIVELRMLSKGAVSKAVESLIQKSLLERIPDREDRRRIHLKLKPEAADLTESIEDVRREFVDTVLEGFTKEELDTHRQFFGRVFENARRAIEGKDQ